MSLKNKLYIIFTDLFSDLYKLCCDKETATKTEKNQYAHPKPDQHVHILTKKWKPLTTEQSGLHSRTVKHRNGSFCTSTLSIKEEPSCTVYKRKRQLCEITRQANEQTSQRVHVSSPTQTHKGTDQA